MNYQKQTKLDEVYCPFCNTKMEAKKTSTGKDFWVVKGRGGKGFKVQLFRCPKCKTTIRKRGAL